MKIAIFTDAFLPNINGVSFSVEIFSQILSKENELEIYAPSFKGVPNLEKRGKVVVRRYYSVPIPTYRDTHFTLPDVVGIVNQVEKFNPDVIHVQTPGSLGLVGILAGRMLKKAVVGTYHTLISEVLVYASLRRSIDRYLQAIDRATGGMVVDLGWLNNGKEHKLEEEKKETIPQKLTWSLVNKVYGYCEIVICPSEAIKRELIKRGVKRRVEVVSNGVDLRMFAVKKNYELTGKILHVGRLGYEKNVDVVIRAYAKAADENPNLRLVIAGDGPARKDLEKMCGEMGLAGRVKFLGMIKRDKLGKVYRECDIFMTASTMETQGMVVLEAMASGLPVIGVKKYALPDLIKDGVNGFVVRPGDDKKMAEKILLIERDKKLLERLGSEARKTAEGHDVVEMSKKLMSEYEDAMVMKFKPGQGISG